MAAAVTQDRPGTKAKVRYVRMSASKARVVLNLIRGKQVAAAAEILEFSERLASEPIGKLLASAVANAEHNEEIPSEELFVSACFADEGPTLKRFRPRARGRAGRIHKQTCHITIEVSRLSDDELDVIRVSSELKSEGRQARKTASSGGGGDRSKRVAKSRAADVVDADEEVVDAEEVEENLEENTEEAVEAEVEEVAVDDSAEETADEGAEDTAEDEAASEEEE